MTTSELVSQNSTDITLTGPLVSNNLADKMEQYVIVDAPGIDIIDKYKTLGFIYFKLKNDFNKFKQIQKKKDEVGSSISLERAKNKKELDVLNGKREFETLLKFAEKDDINSIKKSFDNIWQFNSILKNQGSIHDLIEERESPVKENLTKEINDYVKSIEEAESKAKKHLDGYKKLEAYISGDALNVNISKSEQGNPIKISDIFKLEKEVNQLNICCDCKEEIYAYRKEGKRYYEFKDGSYEMKVSWPVKDENGSYFDCTAIIAVGANGITNILKVEIDGEQIDALDEIVDLAEQNEELYIQGLPLSKALGNFLKLNQGETLRSINGFIKVNKSDSLPKKVIEEAGMFKKLCQTAFSAQLNFQPSGKENVKLRHG